MTAPHPQPTDPSLLPAAIEELLRSVARDVEHCGTTVPEGSVLLLGASANRDGRVFPDPDRFDIHRTGRGHGVRLQHP